MNVPMASATRSIQDLLAERRAVIKESMASDCKVTRQMLAADMKRIDRELAVLRGAGPRVNSCGLIDPGL